MIPTMHFQGLYVPGIYGPGDMVIKDGVVYVATAITNMVPGTINSAAKWMTLSITIPGAFQIGFNDIGKAIASGLSQVNILGGTYKAVDVKKPIRMDGYGVHMVGNVNLCGTFVGMVFDTVNMVGKLNLIDCIIMGGMVCSNGGILYGTDVMVSGGLVLSGSEPGLVCIERLTMDVITNNGGWVGRIENGGSSMRNEGTGGVLMYTEVDTWLNAGRLIAGMHKIYVRDEDCTYSIVQSGTVGWRLNHTNQPGDIVWYEGYEYQANKLTSQQPDTDIDSWTPLGAADLVRKQG